MVKTESFEEALRALEAAVEKLESGQLPLEESLNCFENGVRSAARCQALLKEAETRVEVLMKDRNGRLASEPFAEEGQGGQSPEEI